LELAALWGFSSKARANSIRASTPNRKRWRAAFLARRCSFGLCTSRSTIEMMEHWGLRRGAGFLVPHFGSWDAPARVPTFEDRPFDLMFCGTINERKNPLFFAEVVERMARKGVRARVRIARDGPVRAVFISGLAECGVAVWMDCYLQADDLIEAYSSTKILHIPPHR
jgi:glycosyltransferase involved in cell wall biosynthesis